jgi:hypothetical protein
MNVDYGGGTDAGLYFLLFLFISIAITWLIIYTAVRAAVGHAMDRPAPRLVAEAVTTADEVRFAISNLGTAPVVNLAVRWHRAPAEEYLARTPFLGVNARFEWTMPVPAAQAEELVVRWLEMSWVRHPDPSLGRRSETCPVLVPSRLHIPG